MKKKLLCGLLACMMTFSAAFPLVACKDKIPDQGQTENNGQTPEGQKPEDENKPGDGENPEGNTPDDGNTPGGEEGEQPGENNPEDNPVNPPKEDLEEPGTVITDEETKALLFNSLSETEIGGLSFSASADLTLGGKNAIDTKLSCEGSVLVEEGKVKADLNAFLENEGSDKADRYLMLFMRGGDVYYVMNDWESEEKVNFADLKEQLKSKEDALLLSKGELPKELSEAAETAAIVKMIKNLPALFGGTITKTEGGYSLAFDVGESASSLFEGIGSILKSIDKNHAITLGNIFTQPFFADTLQKLLHGVTAEEFKAAAENFLPEEAAKALPEPTKGATALSYAETLMRSGSFYKALTKEETGWEKWKTFSAVPLEEFLSLFSGEKFTFGEEKLAETFKDYTENLGKKAVNYLFDLLDVDAGEVSDENMLVSLRFEFDNDKKLMGFSVDALIEGARTLPPKSEEPGENENPGDDEEPGETTPGDDEEPGETTPGDDEEPGETTPGDDEEPGETTPGEDEDGEGTNPDGDGDEGQDMNPDGDGDEGQDMNPDGDGDEGQDMNPDGDGDEGQDMNPDGDGDEGQDMNPDGDGDEGQDMSPDGGMEDGDNMDSNDDMGTDDSDSTDGSGDNMPGGKRKSGDTKGTVIRTMKRRKEAEGEKVDIRGSLKIEAVSSSENDLFDLTGCKYETEEGDEVVIEEDNEAESAT